MLSLLFFGWVVAPQPRGFWTLLVAVLASLPILVSALLEAIRKPRARTWRIHLDVAAKSVARKLALAALTLALLPYRAFINLDAILCSGVRMWFTRRGFIGIHLITPAAMRGRPWRDFIRRFGSRRRWAWEHWRSSQLRVRRSCLLARLARSYGCWHPRRRGGSANPPEAPANPYPGPRRRDARVDAERGAAAPEAEDALEAGAVHPAGRAGVPGPAAAAGVRRVGVDVAGDDVRLGLVALDVGRASACG